MSKMSDQLRTNAAAIQVPGAKAGMPEAAIAGCLIMAAEEIERLDEEESDGHRLIARQGKLLTGVVNAIRGEPDEMSMHSHHDAPELARKAMTVVHAARAVLVEYLETLRLAARQGDADANAPNPAMDRMQEALIAMPRPERACEDCGGQGEAMVMECYGGPPIEVKRTCETCKGSGFITDDKPLTDPGVPLPGWEEMSRKVERGEPLTPVEAFILRLTPGDEPRAQDFRRMLRAALDSVHGGAK